MKTSMICLLLCLGVFGVYTRGQIVPFAPPIANDDNARILKGQSVIIDIVTNDTDSDGTIDPSTVHVLDDAPGGFVARLDGIDDNAEWTNLGLDGTPLLSKFIRFRTHDATGVLFDTEFGGGADGGLAFSGGHLTARCSFKTSGTHVINIINDAEAVDGEWHSAGFVYDGTQLRVYFDGVQTAAVAVESDTFHHDYISRCGSRTLSNTLFFSGDLSDFVVYSVGLSDTEVLSYHNGLVTVCDLVLWGKMDEEDYFAGLADSSGNDNNGIANGAVPAFDSTVGVSPAHGTVVDNDDGSVAYTPTPCFCGTDSFRYTVADNDGEVSNEATVTVTVTPMDGPMINHTPLEDTSDLGPYRVIAELENFLEVTRRELNVSINGAAFSTSTMELVEDRLYSAEIPEQLPDNIISYYIEAEDGLGNVIVEPPGAPSETHQFRVIDIGPLHVSPASLEFALLTGESIVHTLRLSNISTAPVEWTLGERPPSVTSGSSIGSLTSSTAHSLAVDWKAEHTEDILLVCFRSYATATARDSIHQTLGCSKVLSCSLTPLDIVKIPENGNLKEICKAYNDNVNVAYAEPNYIQRALGVPNDPSFSDLWGLHNIGQTGGAVDADIDAPEAWDHQRGSHEIIVGVIDTGIDYNHVDLVDNLWTNEAERAGTPGVDDDGNGIVDDIYGARWTSGSGSPTSGDPFDGHRHGTHVAGTIGAVGNNSVGVVGVNHAVRLMGLKFLSDGGSGSTADAISAIEYAVAMGAHVTSNSWGGGGFSTALRDTIAAAGAAGQLFVAAAGNSNRNSDTSPLYPAAYDVDTIISVAASDHNDAKASFSNWGAASVDLAAPGVNTLSTTPGNAYSSLSGTSMATPHVSGVVALLLSNIIPGTADPLTVKGWILNGVDPIAAFRRDGSTPVLTGGRLNAANSLALAGLPWLTENPDTGTLEPGASVEIEVTVDAAGLNGGTYSGEIVINHDISEVSELVIPIRLDVTGIPDIGISDESLDFGAVFVTGAKTIPLTVANDGTDLLTIADITLDNPDFTVDIASFELNPGERQDVIVRFSPPVEGASISVLSIVSNDPDEGTVEIALSGEGLLPPDITASPETIEEDLFTGETSTQTVSIANDGDSDLTFEIAVEGETAESSSMSLDVNFVIETSPDETVPSSEIPNATEDTVYTPTFTKKIYRTDHFVGTSLDNILLMERVAAGVNHYNTALNNLGLPRTVVTSWSGLVTELTNGTEWDLVLANSYNAFPPTTSELNVLNSYLSEGGLLIFADWSVYRYISHPLLESLGVRFVSDFTTPKRFDSTISGHPVFNNPNDANSFIPDANQAHRDGQIMDVLTGATQLAAYASFPTSGAIVLNAERNCIFNGFQAANFNGDDDVDGRTDIIELLENEIIFLSGAVDFVTATPTSATIVPGSSLDITVAFDAAGLNGGEYAANVVITNNDPDESEVLIPVRLHVTGAPDIAISDESFDFGTLFVGASATAVLTVTNDGTDLLTVSDIVSDNDDYTVDTTSFDLNPGESQEVEIQFTPSLEGDRSATLTLTSNDVDEGTVDIALSGSGLLPPDITVSPETLEEDLFTGETSTQTVTITNDGDSELTWAISPQFPETETSGLDITTPLEDILESLNTNFSAITDRVPERFDFSDGETGTSISDGGSDMYDGGNILSTDLGGPIPYSNNTIVDSTVFGSRGRYFTRKYPGLFMLVAEMNDVSRFEINGNLGADGGGSVDGTVLEVNTLGTRFFGFVKRVYDARDPSVNHLIIVEDNSSASHEFSTNTNNDFHRVSNLSENTRLYYLLYAGTGGRYIDDSDTLGIMEAFLDAAALRPPWIGTNPTSGTTAVGESTSVDINFDAAGLNGGDYSANVVITNNDPDESEVLIPVRLHVTGAPDITVSDEAFDFGTLFVGASATAVLTVTNDGTDLLTVSDIASDNDDYPVDITSFDLNPGESQEVQIQFTPSVEGDRSATLTITSNDVDEGTVDIALAGSGLLPPDITVGSEMLEEDLFTGETSTQTLTIANEGDSELAWAISPQFAETETSGLDITTPLEDILESLNTNFSAITDRVPERFDFSDGETGTSISDGGRDMYDGGNILSTDHGGAIPYSNNTIVGSAIFGSEGRYFTRKYPGLFVLVAEMNEVSRFEINGNLGADGRGNVDGAVLEVDRLGTRFFGFVKRVYNAGDPSVNHLIIVEDNSTANHDFSTNTNHDFHRVSNVSENTRLYYLLYAGRDGRYIDDSDTLGIMEAFLDAAALRPPWIGTNPTSGTTAVGESTSVAFQFDAAGLNGGDYSANVVITNNDPDESEVLILVRLHVTGAPDIAVSDESFDFGTLFVGASATAVLTVTNDGTDLLTVSDIASDNDDYPVDITSFDLNPGESQEVEIQFTPSVEGDRSATLTITSNDVDEGTVDIALAGSGLLPPDITVSPEMLEEDLFTGETSTQTVTIANDGESDLTFDISFDDITTDAFGVAPKISPTTGEIIRTIPSPGTLYGITWLNDRLWGVLTSTRPYQLVEINPENGEVLSSFSVGDRFPVGLTTDGTNLWVTNTSSSIQAYSTDGVLLTTWSAPLASPWGIAWDGMAFWIGGSSHGQLFRVDVNGTVLEARTLSTSVVRTLLGMEWVDEHSPGQLWIADNNTSNDDVNQFNPLTDPLMLIQEVAHFHTNKPTGIAHDGKNLWISASSNSEIIVVNDGIEEAPPWISGDPNTGVVGVGASIVVDIHFDAAGLNGGDYTANVVIANNDPDESEVLIPVRLHVTGAPDITVSDEAFDFGTLFVGASATAVLTVSNDGTDLLTVSDIISDNDDYTVDITSFDLNPGESQEVQIQFTPSVEGDRSATLTITSNDVDEGTVDIALAGSGLLPPDITVNPEMLEEDLFTGETSTQTVTITNDGDSELTWAISPQSAETETSGLDITTPLEDILESLNTNFSAITDRVPERFDFSDGETGTSISDGGSDMYDGGNILSTDLGGPIPYSNNTIVDSTVFGSRGRYFTRKYPGLFMLVAEMNDVSRFEINGNLGADGGGSVDGTVLEVNTLGTRFFGFVKRVYDARDPSVNHLIIVEDNSSASHEFSTNTNNDFHRVSNLSENTRLYYLLYAGTGGRYIDDSDTLGIMEAFLDAAALRPPWIGTNPTSGTTAVGESTSVDINFDAAGLNGGDYSANVVITNNDPDESEVLIPVRLHVTGAPDITVSDEAFDFGTLFVGASATAVLTVTNDGTDLLTVSDIASDNDDYPVDITSFDLNPGESQEVQIQFTPSVEGDRSATLTLTSNDVDEGTVDIALSGSGLLPPDIAVSPEMLEEVLAPEGTSTQILSLSNDGDSELSFEISIDFAADLSAELSRRFKGDTNDGNPNLSGLDTLPNSTAIGNPDSDTIPILASTLNETEPTSDVTGLAAEYRGNHLHFGISDYGEIMPFQFPIGSEHLMRGAFISGYTLAYIAGGVDVVTYAQFGVRSGIEPVSFTELVNTDRQVVVRVVVQTTDGNIEITRTFTFNRVEKFVHLATQLRNTSEGELRDVVFKSLADWDVNSVFSNDWDYDRTRNMVYAHENVYAAIASKQIPDLMDIRGWDDRLRRLTHVDFPTGPVIGHDGLELLHYELGDLSTGSFEEVTTVFAAGTDLVDLRNSVDRGLIFQDWLSAEPLTGTIPAGDTLEIAITFDAADLEEGDYGANIMITSNDPDERNVLVPVRLTVNNNVPPLAEDDRVETTQNQRITIDVLSNDTDSDGRLNPASSTVIREPLGSFVPNFDGVDDSLIWTDLGFDGAPVISKFIMFRTTDTSGVLFDTELGAGADGGLSITGGMLRLRCAFQDAGLQVVDIVSDTIASDGGWHSAGFVYDGTTLKTYFDGIQTGIPLPIVDDAIRHDYTSVCGRRTLSNSLHFSGNLRNFVVYNTSLSELDIANYHNGLVSECDLVLWGKMDENNYSEGLRDSSGNENHGTADGTEAVFDPTQGVIPSHGVVVDNEDGTISYTSVPCFLGVDTFGYTVEDDDAAVSNRATVTVQVSPENIPPIAIDDTANVRKGQNVVIDVIANDTDDDGTINPSRVSIPQPRYVAGFDGIDDRIIWGELGIDGVPFLSKFIRFRTTDTHCVLFDVEFGSGADGGLFIAGGALLLRCSFNLSGTQVLAIVDSDFATDGNWHSAGFTYNGTTLTAYFDGEIAGAPISISGDTVRHNYPSTCGGRLFSNSRFYAGELSDFVVYKAALSEAKVLDYHNGVVGNENLVLWGKMDEEDYSGGLMDSSGNGHMGSSNGATPLLDTMTPPQPANGTVINNGDGTVTYIPNSGFIGEDDFRYTVTDNRGALSNIARVRITVLPPNRPPMAADDEAETREGEHVTIDVVANDTDEDGSVNPASVAVVQPNYVASFDGIDDKIIWGDLGLNGTPVLSKFIRFRTTDTSGVLFDVEFGNGADGGLYLAGGMLRLRCAFQDSGIHAVDIVSAEIAADGAWHSAGFTYDGASLTAYFDGSAMGTPVSIPEDTIRHAYPSTCGRRVLSNSFFFSGELSTFVVYNAALSASEALNYHNREIHTDDLVLWGKMDEEDYADGLADASGHGHTGMNDGAVPVLDPLIPVKPSHGTVVNNGDGTITYIPDIGFSGEDSFGYTVEDNEGGSSNVARVMITVIGDDGFLPEGNLYWVTPLTRSIHRTNLDDEGRVIEDVLVSLPSSPSTIAVDAAGGKLYWTDIPSQIIKRSDLDGSNEEILIVSDGTPWGIAVDNQHGKIYWTDRKRDLSDKIKRANLDGTEIEDLVTAGLSSPGYIALDVSGDKLYWVDRLTNKIQRANLDGSNIQDLLTFSTPNAPSGIALDISTDKMYWTDSGSNRIQRSNLDGSGIETLISTGIEFPTSIAIDSLRGKIYWTDLTSSKVHRANLDGTEKEDVIPSGLINATSVVFSRPGVEPTIEFASRAVAVNETENEVELSVRLNMPGDGELGEDLTVDLVIADAGTATHGGDFVTISSPELTFSAGSTDGVTQPFSLGIIPDDITEGNETLYVRLANIQGSAALGRQTVTKVIVVDDDIGNIRPHAEDDSGETVMDASATINMVVNDLDEDGTLAPESIEILQPRHVASFDGVNDRIVWGELGLDSAPFLSKFIRFRTTDTSGVLFDVEFGSGADGGLFLGTGKLKLRCSFERTRVQVIDLVDASIAADGIWHSAGFTYDGGQLIAYFDGEPVGEALFIPGDVIQHDYPTTCGGRVFSNSSFFAGELADFVIYNASLSEVQIEDYHNHIVTLNNLALWGRMDENDYIDGLDDSSGHGHTGVSNGTIPLLDTTSPKPANGMVTNNGDGTATYTPDSGFVGEDSFQYTIEDTDGAVSNVATVRITVLPPNRSPMAADDEAETREGERVTIDVVANDTDEDGSINPASVTVVQPNYVASFDGIDDKIIWGDLGLNGTSVLSKFIRFRTVDTNGVLFDVEFGNGADGGLYLAGGMLRLRCAFHNSGTHAVDIISAETAADGAWHSAGFTYDGASLTTYFDGVVMGTPVSIPEDALRHAYPSTCGGRILSSSFFFAGELSAFVVYKAALSASEALNYHNREIRTDDLVLWGKMDEEDYADGLADASGHGHTGVSDGAIPVVDPLNPPKPRHGTAVSNGDGTVTYTPNPDFVGVDSFEYSVEDDAGAVSNVATVIILVNSATSSSLPSSTSSSNPAGVTLGEFAIKGTQVFSTVEGVASKTVYEDAEDGSIEGWLAYGKGTVLNKDDGFGNRIIVTEGTVDGDSFRLGLADRNDWNNTEEFIASFTILMEGEATVYFRVATTEGEKYLCYRPGNDEAMDTNDTVLCFGLGIEQDGQWHSITRNLATDLERVKPNAILLSVTDFYVFGNAKLDDIMLRNYIVE